MRETGGRAVVRALEDEGVPFTFGIPGTHNIELYDALGSSESVTAVLVTDEQAASFMADAVWRASGRLGCVNVVPGAGLTHALSGIAEAYLDTVPLLVLGCGIRRDTGHAFQLHDVDQMAMVAPVTKAQLRPERGEELYAAVRRAARTARSGVPGPVFVEVPAELYVIPHPREEAAESVPEPPPPPAASAADVARAAELLAVAERPLLYLGLGAAGAGEDLVRLAEALEAPVSTTFQGKGVFPESHPLWLWPGFGRSAPPFVREVAESCDATLAVGCRFSEVGTGSYGLEPPRPLVHVDLDPDVPGRNYATDLGVIADSAAFVLALLEALSGLGLAVPGGRSPSGASPIRPTGRPEPAADSDLRERVRKGHADVWREWEEAAEGTEGVSTPRLLRRLQERLGPETVFTADSGNGMFLAVEGLRLDRPGRFLAPVDYSCMGYSVPAAVGAALARPGRPAVALAGDGAFLMTGLELLTAASRDLPVLAAVLRDGELAQIAQFQEVALDRKVASRLPDYDLAALCAGTGVECLPVASDGDLEGALDRALAILGEGRPVALDVAVDYAHPTWFTRGVVKTHFLRLPWRERLRMLGRAAWRRTFG